MPTDMVMHHEFCCIVAQNDRGIDAIRPRAICRRMERALGYVIPVAIGEGLFVPIGLLPRRRPLTTVVGKPIAVPKCTAGENSAEFGKLLEDFHIKYITSLLELYDQHKDQYDKDRTSDMRLVE